MKEESPQKRLQTVMYVRRNESEAPFPVVVNVEAMPELKQGADVLEVVPGPMRRGGLNDMFLGWGNS